MKWESKDISKLIDDILGHKAYSWLHPLHRAAEAGILDKLPKEAFTPEGLIKQSHGGTTPLHYAAKHHQLKYIPKELFNQENLLKGNELGTTPMHCAAEHGCLNQIPEKFLKDKLLNNKNFLGMSCLHFAIERKSEIKLILSKLSTKSLRYYLKNVDTKTIYPKIKQEIQKRKLVKELSKDKQSIEI